jgi:Tfp pilus assembly protein PilF
MLGELYVRGGRTDAARRQFEAMIQRTPSSIGANTMLGMLFELEGRRAEAEAQYRKVLQYDRTSPVASNNLAWLLVSSDRKLDEALQLAQNAQRHLQDDPDVNDTLGWIYYKQGQANLAIFPLEQSVAKDATNAEYRYHLGLAYLKAGDFKKAKSTLEEALKQGGTGFAAAAEVRKALASIQGRL